MNQALNEFSGTVRCAVDDYRMIEEGDTIAVGVSGGKDSLLLLDKLQTQVEGSFQNLQKQADGALYSIERFRDKLLPSDEE